MAPGVVADVPAFRVPDVGPRAFAVFVDFRIAVSLVAAGQMAARAFAAPAAWAVPVESLAEWPYKNTIGSFAWRKG